MNDIFQEHPKWRELERLVEKSDYYKRKARELRIEIDRDLFGSSGFEEEKEDE